MENMSKLSLDLVKENKEIVSLECEVPTRVVGSTLEDFIFKEDSMILAYDLKMALVTKRDNKYLGVFQDTSINIEDKSHFDTPVAKHIIANYIRTSYNL